MRGHIRCRGKKKWAVVVDVGRDEQGQRKQRWHSGYTTKKAAELALPDILSRLEAGTYVKPTKQTVSDYLRQWLDGQRSRLRPSTHRSYTMNIETHVIPRVGALPLQKLSAAGLNALYADLLTKGRRHPANTPLSPRSVRYVHTIIRKALSDAARTDDVSRNVADLTTPPSSKSGRAMQTWNAEELHAFLDHVRDDRLYAAWLLSASTGMRRGEVLSLRWRDVDFDAKRVSITQTVLAVRNTISYSTPKTDRGRRMVSLDVGTVAQLRAHKVRQLKERVAADPGYADNGLVFTREDGEPVHPDRFSDLFEKHVRHAGLPKIRLHDLRHGHASLALQAGVHPKVVSERLGHSTIAITLDTYSHVLPGLQEDAAEKVAAIVFGT